MSGMTLAMGGGLGALLRSALGGPLPMMQFFGGGGKAFFMGLPGMLLWAVAFGFLYLKWREKDDEDKDPQMELKLALYAVEVFAFQAVLFGVFLVLDFVFGKIGSEGLPKEALLSGLGFIVGGAGTLFGMEVLLGSSNTAEFWRPRKFFYEVNALITLLYGVVGLVWFLGSLFSWASGQEFHVPLTLTIVYVPSAFVAVMLVKSLFGAGGAPTGALANGLLALGGTKVQSWGDQAAAGMGAAASGFDSAVQAASQPAAQPMGGQPMGGMGGQPMGGEAAQPVAQQPVAAAPAAQPQSQACPTCGGQARYIAQYQRYWCDTCQKYL